MSVCTGLVIIDNGRTGVVVKSTSTSGLWLAGADLPSAMRTHHKEFTDIVAIVAGVKYRSYMVGRPMPVRTSTITYAHTTTDT